MRRRGVLALGVTLAGASGCSLLVTTSGLAGDPETTVGGDGSVTTTGDAASTDGAPADGAVRDAPIAPGDASSPCAAAHLFCDDFDTGDTNLGTRWDSFRQSSGPITLDTSTFLSAPRALRATLTPGNGVRVSELRKAFSPKSSKTRVDFDLLIEGPTGSFGELDPAGLEFYPPPSNLKDHGLAIAMYESQTVLQYHASPVGGGMSTAVETPFTLPTSRWVHVTMTADYSTPQPTGAIALDGTQVAAVTMGGAAPSSIEVTLGLIYSEAATGTFTSVFDNVVVD